MVSNTGKVRLCLLTLRSAGSVQQTVRESVQYKSHPQKAHLPQNCSAVETKLQLSKED